MKRILIEVAYDGTGYCGWQIQPNGLTVEAVLNQTLSDFLKEDIRIIGASRTDSGVHAMGNIAVFDTDTTIPPDRICYAVNPFLPEDIRIISSGEVEKDFHPRKVRSEKTYEYHIQNTPIPYPTISRYAHCITPVLDVEAMQQAGEYLVGTHDFKSFCASGSQAVTTVRTVTGLKIYTKEIGKGREIIIEIKGEGFLYNMVRIISGTLIKAGLGIYPPEHVAEILKAENRKAAGETMPAKGLVLKKIELLHRGEEENVSAKTP